MSRRKQKKARRSDTGFADRLRQAMDRRGMSQMDLSKAAHVGQPTVHDWLHKNAYPHSDVLADVARALRVTTDSLLFGTTGREAAPSVVQAFQDGGLTALGAVRRAVERIEGEWRGVPTETRAGVDVAQDEKQAQQTPARGRRRRARAQGE